MAELIRAPRVAVIGGGLTGLAAAQRLTELAAQQQRPIEVTVFEAGPQLGGIVGSERIGDYLVDVGADSFLTNKPAAVGLCRRLGIEDRLRATNPQYRGAHVLFDGRPVKVPDGFQLLSPTAFWPVITSPLFSAWGKCRLLMEWTVPSRQQRVADRRGEAHLLDESLADFSRRRFGNEAFERLIQPLIGGIYTADPERLSLAATLPRFLEMERDYGSVIGATLAQRFRRKLPDGTTSSGPADRSSGARYGLFAGLAGGLNDLLEPLRRVINAKCQVRLCRTVTQVSQLRPVEGTAGGGRRFELQFADDPAEEFAAVVVASPAHKAAAVLKSCDERLAAELSAIEYASSALVVTGHRLADIRHPLDSFGLVIPQAERRQILAVSFSSRKFPERAPQGHVLLRTFVGGALQPELLNQRDSELVQLVRGELADIFGVRGEPDFVRVYRYNRAMPQYHVGHRERIDRIGAIVAGLPGLVLAGNAYRGTGIPDVLASGERAAEVVLQQI